MRNLPTVVREQHQQHWLRRIAEGASYARREPVVGLLLVVVAIFSLFAMNRLTLMPLFADQVLHVGATGFGFLMGAMGLGALAGALTLAFFPALGADPERQFWLGMIWVAALLTFSLSRSFPSRWLRCCRRILPDLVRRHGQQPDPDPDSGQPPGRVMALYAQSADRRRARGQHPGRRAGDPVRRTVAMAIRCCRGRRRGRGVRLLRPEVFSVTPISPAEPRGLRPLRARG